MRTKQGRAAEVFTYAEWFAAAHLLEHAGDEVHLELGILNAALVQVVFVRRLGAEARSRWLAFGARLLARCLRGVRHPRLTAGFFWGARRGFVRLGRACRLGSGGGHRFSWKGSSLSRGRVSFAREMPRAADSRNVREGQCGSSRTAAPR